MASIEMFPYGISQSQDLLKQVSKISRTATSLNEDLSALEESRDHLDRDVDLSLMLPNRVLKQLVSLLDISALEDDLQTEQEASSWTLLRPRCSSEAALKRSLVSIMKDLVQIELIAEATAQKANECQLRAAHLVHEAVKQEDICKTILSQLSLEQRQAQLQLDVFAAKRNSIRSQIYERRRFKGSLEAKVRDLDERVENNWKWLERTWWILGVNLVTLPVNIVRVVHHEHKKDQYEGLANHVDRDLIIKGLTVKSLEAQTGTVSKVHRELEHAIVSCTGIEKRSKQQRDEAKTLVTKFQGVSDKSRDVKEALMLFQHGVNSGDSLNARWRVLQTVVELSRHLLDHDLLAQDQRTVSSLMLLHEAYDRGCEELKERCIQASSSDPDIFFLDDF